MTDRWPQWWLRAKKYHAEVVRYEVFPIQPQDFQIRIFPDLRNPLSQRKFPIFPNDVTLCQQTRTELLVGTASGSSVSLPLLLHPVEGEPCENSQWNGSSREVAGPAAARLDRIKQPYILHFGHDDVRGRLRKGNLLLVSQIGSEHAEIGAVKFRKKVLLARHNENGTWERVTNGTTLPETAAVVGHCVAIIWSSLE